MAEEGTRGPRIADRLLVSFAAKCSCGAPASFLNLVEFDFDAFDGETLRSTARRALEEFSHACEGCTAPVPRERVSRLLVAYPYRDGSGTLLLRAGQGVPAEARGELRPGFRFQECALDRPLRPEELAGGGASFDALPWRPEVTGEEGRRVLGRVPAVRSRWLELLEAWRRGRGPVIEPLGPGLWAGIRSPGQEDAYARLIEGSGLLDGMRERRIVSLPLHAVDTLEPKAREVLGPGSPREWMPADLRHAMAEGMVEAETIVDLGQIVDCARQLASVAGLEAERVESAEDADDEGAGWVVRLSSRHGFHASLRPEPIFLHVACQQRTIGEQVAFDVSPAAEALRRIDRLIEFLRSRLPEGARFDIDEEGLGRVSRDGSAPQVVSLAGLAAKFDLDDPQQADRLMQVVLTGRQCDCSAYVGKKLKSVDWFEAARQRLRNLDDAGVPTHRRIGEHVQVYSLECEHDSRYSAEIGGGDPKKAEEEFRRDAERHIWHVVAVQPPAHDRPQVAVVGPNVASLALHAGFLRRLVTETGLSIPGPTRVFAPVTGVLAVSSMDVAPAELRVFAERVIAEIVTARFPQFGGEDLGYWAVERLPTVGEGRVAIEGEFRLA